MPEEVRRQERLDSVREPHSPGYRKHCPYCGAPLKSALDFGPSFGRNETGAPGPEGAYVPGPEAYASDEGDEYTQPHKPSLTLTIGGIMIFVSGLAGLIGGMLLLSLAGVTRAQSFIGYSVTANWYEACGLFGILASIIPLYGGYQTLMGKTRFAASLGAGIVGIIVGVLIFGPLGLVPGLVGVILVAIGKDEFEE